MFIRATDCTGACHVDYRICVVLSLAPSVPLSSVPFHLDQLLHESGPGGGLHRVRWQPLPSLVYFEEVEETCCSGRYCQGCQSTDYSFGCLKPASFRILSNPFPVLFLFQPSPSASLSFLLSSGSFNAFFQLPSGFFWLLPCFFHASFRLFSCFFFPLSSCFRSPPFQPILGSLVLLFGFYPAIFSVCFCLLLANSWLYSSFWLLSTFCRSFPGLSPALSVLQSLIFLSSFCFA